MTILKCDRCKKTFDCKFPQYPKGKLLIKVCGPREHAKDLCEECQAELQEWFNAKRGEENA